MQPMERKAKSDIPAFRATCPDGVERDVQFSCVIPDGNDFGPGQTRVRLDRGYRAWAAWRAVSPTSPRASKTRGPWRRGRPGDLARSPVVDALVSSDGEHGVRVAVYVIPSVDVDGVAIPGFLLAKSDGGYDGYDFVPGRWLKGEPCLSLMFREGAWPSGEPLAVGRGWTPPGDKFRKTQILETL